MISTKFKYPLLTSGVIILALIIGSFVFYHYEQKKEILSVYSRLDQHPKPTTRELPSKEGQEYIRILSIEGGGQYGILPAHVLKYMENISGKSVSDLFDFMMGASSGSLQSVLLTMPGKDNRPRYTAQDILNFYNSDGKNIFYNPWYHRILTLNGLIGPKYVTTARYEIFKEYLGDVYFDQLINNVAIPAYDVNQNIPLLFVNWLQPNEPTTNFAVADLLMGAVSPPGLFPSVAFGSGGKRFVLADGAIFANNPALAAVLMAMKAYPNKKYVLVSLATGKPSETLRERAEDIVDWGEIKWGEKIVPVLVRSNMKFNNILLENIFPFPLEIYYFNIEIDRSGSIDNITQSNIEILNRDGERLVEENRQVLDAMVQRLLNP